MRTLYVDFETRSEADIKTVGGEKYCMDESTEYLLCAYAWNDDPVQVCEKGDIPADVLKAFCTVDDSLRIVAHNAGFDMCVAKYLLYCDVTPAQWYDTVFVAAYYGYPRALGNLANYLNTTKKASQEALMLFSTPLKRSRKATAADLFGGDMAAKWATKVSHPEQWETFKAYAAGDVDVMRECNKRMPELPQIELRAMILTLEMNLAGVPFDANLARIIEKRAHGFESAAGAEAMAKYDIANLRSVPQVQKALQMNGVFLPSLNSAERGDVTHEILELRDRATGAAFRKIPTCFERLCPDQRLRGEFRGNGTHTGRWSSHGAQMQNWARILEPDKLTLDPSTCEDYGLLRQHLRLCLCHAPGLEFVGGDLSQIEARITAWGARCRWLMDAFASGDDVYSRTSEKMFKTPRDPQTGKHPKRQEGKACVLGFGFGGGAGTIAKISPKLYREIGDEGANALCQTYRQSHPEIVQLWYDLDRAWRKAMRDGSECLSFGYSILKFTFDGHTMRITLPSGRALWYRTVATSKGAYRDELSYCDYSQGYAVTSKIWHGVIMENIVQAIARDVLVDIMWRVRNRLIEENVPLSEIVGTVHDEVWVMTHKGHGENVLHIVLDEMKREMRAYPNLVTKGEGVFGERYMKA